MKKLSPADQAWIESLDIDPEVRRIAALMAQMPDGDAAADFLLALPKDQGEKFAEFFMTHLVPRIRKRFH